MRQSASCGLGLQGEAKIDHFGQEGRIRGTLLFFAVRPARLRMDLLAPPPLQGPVATLTSDGVRFAFADLRQHRFFVGPAAPCNIARLTTVPIAGHVLVGLLRGQAPVLRHEPSRTRIAWNSSGFYELTLEGAHESSERIRLVPHDADRDRPWSEQRVRVLDVEVRQQGIVLYHAELDEHAAAPMASPALPEIPGDPTIAVSGPHCTAEVPRTIHVEVPGKSEDIRFRYVKLEWNPPLAEGTFTQDRPQGMPLVRVGCEEPH
jgi:hypothetical protein